MTCPICGRECGSVGKQAATGEAAVEKTFLPFCSQRCQQIDFHRWWQGRYAIVEEMDGGEDIEGGE